MQGRVTLSTCLRARRGLVKPWITSRATLLGSRKPGRARTSVDRCTAKRRRIISRTLRAIRSILIRPSQAPTVLHTLAQRKGRAAGGAGEAGVLGGGDAVWTEADFVDYFTSIRYD